MSLAAKTLLGIAAVLGAHQLVASEVKQQPLLVRPYELTWRQPFGPGGMSLAFVIGTLGNHNPASYFIRLPAGFRPGWHIHSNDYEAVVRKGTFTAQEQGQPERELPVGSFVAQPGRQNHRNGCVSGGEECLIFIHYEHGADAQPMTAEGKPLPAPQGAAKGQ